MFAPSTHEAKTQKAEQLNNPVNHRYVHALVQSSSGTHKSASTILGSNIRPAHRWISAPATASA
jgi:hypothetical protein